MKTKWLLVTACVLLLSFAGFSKLAKQGKFESVDFDVTVKIQDRMPKRLDEAWEDISFFVAPIPSVVFIGILTLVALFSFREKRIRWGALIIPFAFAALIAGEIYGKNVVHHPAPPFFMIKNPTTIFPKYHVIEQYSYPSGHAARAVFIAIVASFIVWRAKKRPWTQLIIYGVLAFYVMAVCVGKIYLGHHWISDVVGGFLLGLSFGVFGLILL